MKEEFYFVGRYAETGHEEKAAGVERGRAYPVFITYNKDNPDEKHTHSWFIFECDAISYAKFKNAHRSH